MDKIHTIEFNTEQDKEELKKKVSDCIDSAYEADEDEMFDCDIFISEIADLTLKTFDMSESLKEAVNEWASAMLHRKPSDRRSFRASYARAFSEIASDIIELAKDHREITHPNRKEPKD